MGPLAVTNNSTMCGLHEGREKFCGSREVPIIDLVYFRGVKKGLKRGP